MKTTKRKSNKPTISSDNEIQKCHLWQSAKTAPFYCTVLTNLCCSRWCLERSMLRRRVQRSNADRIRVGATCHIPRLGNAVSPCRIRRPVSHPNCDETRWNQNRQTGTPHASDRRLQRSVYGSCHISYSLLSLRATLLRSVASFLACKGMYSL